MSYILISKSWNLHFLSMGGGLIFHYLCYTVKVFHLSPMTLLSKCFYKTCDIMKGIGWVGVNTLFLKNYHGENISPIHTYDHQILKFSKKIQYLFLHMMHTHEFWMHCNYIHDFKLGIFIKVVAMHRPKGIEDNATTQAWLA